MIPKIIHYCWFGKKKLTPLLKDCVQSWRTHLPQYEIRCWNEYNLPIRHPFIESAIKMQYFAFAADLVRLLVVQKYGGIYMDTDMLVVKNFDELLEYDFFLGEEVPGRINLAIFGAIPQHPVVNSFIEFYTEKEFNPADLPIISYTLSKVLERNKNEVFSAKDKILGFKCFYPLPFENRNENYSGYIYDETYAVHLWNHSWRNVTDYIEERKYFKALAKIGRDLRFNKSTRLNRDYYSNIFWHLKTSLKSFIRSKLR